MNWISLTTKSRVQSSKGFESPVDPLAGRPAVVFRTSPAGCVRATGMEVFRCRVGKPPAVGLGLVYRSGSSVANHHLTILSRRRREGDGEMCCIS